MEMVLKNELFEMNDQELMDVDGGIGTGAVILLIVIGLALTATAKGCADADKEAGH